MEPTPHATDARVVRLLATLVALMAMLIAGLGVAGAGAWREYARARDALGVTAPDGAAHRVLVELSQRQQAASGELAAMQKDASRQIAQLERRIAHAREKGRGPVDSAKKAVEFTEIMADQTLLLLKLTTTLDSVMEKGSRPLPAQRDLLEASGATESSRSPQRAGRR